MGIESKSQEKYPPISKKEPVMGMESRRQGKMPAKIKKKADKKESR